MCVIEITPTIETRRLSLRAPEPRDVDRLAQLGDDNAIARMTCRMPSPYTGADADAFVAQAQASDPTRARAFVIEHEDEGAIGVIGLYHDRDRLAETGYWIGRRYWGRGFATEALGGLLDWASRRWKARGVMAGHFQDNAASGRVLEKAGFLYTGEVRRQRSVARGAEVDTRMMVWLA